MFVCLCVCVSVCLRACVRAHVFDCLVLVGSAVRSFFRFFVFSCVLRSCLLLLACVLSVCLFWAGLVCVVACWCSCLIACCVARS